MALNELFAIPNSNSSVAQPHRQCSQAEQGKNCLASK